MNLSFYFWFFCPLNIPFDTVLYGILGNILAQEWWVSNLLEETEDLGDGAMDENIHCSYTWTSLVTVLFLYDKFVVSIKQCI